jgi:hypothetical protein
MFQLIPRTQLEIETSLERQLRDTSNNLWSDVEFYDAINHVLGMWGNRVVVPFAYSITSGFSSTEKEYSLPEYVVEPIDVQFQVTGEDYYRDVDGFSVHPTTGGSKVLRLAHFPWDYTARVIYWPSNGPVPTTVPTLNATISSTTATTCTMTAIPTIGQNGYVKIEAEWMAYHGPTQTATVTTLNNLERGCFGTTAATHNSGATVTWGIVAHRTDLFDTLQLEAMMYLHAMFATNASGTEVDKHRWNMRWWDGKVDAFWKRFVPMRQPRMRLTAAGIGPLPRNTQRYYTNDIGYWG